MAAIAARTIPERVAEWVQLNRGVAKMAEEAVRRRHPEYDDRQVFLALVRQYHGDDLVRGLARCPGCRQVIELAGVLGPWLPPSRPLTSATSSSVRRPRCVWGVVRTTRDIDVVVVLNADDDAVLAALRETDLYVPVEQARKAASTGGSFNVLDPLHGGKLDLFVTDTADLFTSSRMERRIKADVFDVPCWVASAEDVVLAKPGGGSNRGRRPSGVIASRSHRSTTWMLRTSDIGRRRLTSHRMSKNSSSPRQSLKSN